LKSQIAKTVQKKSDHRLFENGMVVLGLAAAHHEKIKLDAGTQS